MALISVSNNALSDISTLPASIPTGSLTLIKSITASASANISFVHGTDGVVLDGTYLSYVFKFINIHPATDDQFFQFQVNASGQSGFNETITSTFFRAYHFENDGASGLDYRTANDQAQGTSYQYLSENVGNADDESCAGYLQLFNPSSTTYVKHFIGQTELVRGVGGGRDSYIAGYINTVSAITEIDFKMSSGNIDDGIIKLYGVK